MLTKQLPLTTRTQSSNMCYQRRDEGARAGILTSQEPVEVLTEGWDGDGGGGKTEKEARRGICRRFLCSREGHGRRVGARER